MQSDCLKSQGSVWNCLWGHALKRSYGINRKSTVLYPGSRFLSSATWPLLPKKHYNGLINQSRNFTAPSVCEPGPVRLCSVHLAVKQATEA